MSDDDLTISEVRALLGTTRRDARWHLTDELDILCLFARARFDLRQVETTGNDVVEVSVTCAFGSVDFVVPDGTMVVLDGTSFLASANSDVSAEGDSELPRIEITATTVLGRVKIVSPSHDENAQDDDVVEITAEPVPAPAAEATPVAEAPAPAPAQPAPMPIPAASPMPVPKPPPSKYAVATDDADDAPAATPAPVVPQPPANKYAVPAEEPEPAAAAPVVPQPPANKYAVPAEEPEPAAAAPVVPQPPANKYAVPAEEPATDDAAPAPVVPQPPANKYAVPAEDSGSDAA